MEQCKNGKTNIETRKTHNVLGHKE